MPAINFFIVLSKIFRIRDYPFPATCQFHDDIKPSSPAR